MNNKYDFRVGFQPFMLTPPSELDRGMEQYRWTLEECQRLGARAISFMPNFIPQGANADTFQEMADMAREKDVKLLTYALSVWSLAGNTQILSGNPFASQDGAAARAGVERMIEISKILGSDIMCAGYGMLNVKSSRYNKEFPYQEQKKHIISCLKEMSKILEGTGITFAYENHCDFNGKEIAGIIEEVGADNIRVQYDFGNGAIVLCDPMEDLKYLVPYAVSAHFKDFKVIDNPDVKPDWPDMSMRTTGCYLGEGFVNLEKILETIIQKAPSPQGMCLLAEPAFQLPETEEERNDLKEFDRKVTRQYVTKMQEIVNKLR